MPDWLQWAAMVGASIGVVGWAVGLPAVLRIAATIAEIAAPAVKMVVEAAVGVLKWTWLTVIWPGLKDIFDNWCTIAVVLGSMMMLYSWMDRRIDIATEDLKMCQSEMTKLKRSLKKDFQYEDPNWLWNFWR